MWKIQSLALFLFFLLGSPATAVTTHEVETALTCQCGCGLTVHSCNHLQCGFAVPVKQAIAEQVGQGKARQEIVDSFVSRYGEKVLSAPTTVGFNLAAWITPFLAVVIGGVLIGIVSVRWTKRRSQAEPKGAPLFLETDQYRDRLKKELDSFEI